MNTTIQISVLLPVYNAALYLKETIESILSQTFSDFELIIINDGSKDDSEAIINSFQDSRIKYIENQQNIGLIATLNKGIDLSNGKYIARMDADDICLPLRFEKQWNLMEANPDIDVCGTSITYFNEKGLIKNWDVPEKDKDIKTQLLIGPGFSHPTVFFRSSSLKQNKIYYSVEYVHAEDYELWVRLATLGFRFQNINEVLLYYRLHEENVSKTNQTSQKSIHLKIQKQQFEHFLNRALNKNEILFFTTLDRKLPVVIYLKTAKGLINELENKNKESHHFDTIIMKKKVKYFFCNILDFSNLTGSNLVSIGLNMPSEFIFCLKKYLKTRLFACSLDNKNQTISTIL